MPRPGRRSDWLSARVAELLRNGTGVEFPRDDLEFVERLREKIRISTPAGQQSTQLENSSAAPEVVNTGAVDLESSVKPQLTVNSRMSEAVGEPPRDLTPKIERSTENRDADADHVASANSGTNLGNSRIIDLMPMPLARNLDVSPVVQPPTIPSPRTCGCDDPLPPHSVLVPSMMDKQVKSEVVRSDRPAGSLSASQDQPSGVGDHVKAIATPGSHASARPNEAEVHPRDVPEQQSKTRLTLTPQQLDNLVAPLALYPDPLLSQVLVAATYPLEVVQANQWLQQNRNVTGAAVVDAARRQNWDPSVQALVIFPDVLARLNQDVRWTTDLGNAILGQQAEVITAVQRLRARAQANGKLQNTPQETVTVKIEAGQTAIAVQPTDPAVIRILTYDPTYIWGPPIQGSYPPLVYPAYGSRFGFAMPIGRFFLGLQSWFSWGWSLNWFGRTVVVNVEFFNRYGYHLGGGYRAGLTGAQAWVHDPAHSPRVGGQAGYSRSYQSPSTAYRPSAADGHRGGANANRTSNAFANRGHTIGTRGYSQSYASSQRSLGSYAQRYPAVAQRYSAPPRSLGNSGSHSFSGGGFRSGGSRGRR